MVKKTTGTENGGKEAGTGRAAEAAPNRMWGGRFTGGPGEAMAAINPSIDFDRALYAEDIRASRAHCAMLVRQKIISEADGNSILAGLDTVLAEIEDGSFRFERALEDIHGQRPFAPYLNSIIAVNNWYSCVCLFKKLVIAPDARIQRDSDRIVSV